MQKTFSTLHFYSPFFCLFLLSILMLLASSCEPECEDTRTNLLKIQFYKSSTLLRDTLAFAQITGIDNPLTVSDSILYTQQDVLSIFTLPISPTEEQVRFRFEKLESNGSTSIKNITFAYQLKWQVIKPNCGLNALITNLRVLESDFDSTSVIQNELTNNPDEINVQIFN